MSKYFVEVPNGDGPVSGRTVESDYVDVEFGVLKFYKRDSTKTVVAAFNQWNSFRPEEII